MANPWDNDPIVSGAPAGAAPAAAAPAASAPWANDPAASTSALAAPAVAASPAAGSGGNPWDHDPVVSAAPAQPDTSLMGRVTQAGQQFMHGAGVVARGALQGATDLAGMASDAITQPINVGLDAVEGQGNGFRFQHAGDAMSHVMDAAGVPQAQNGTERVVQDVARGVGSAASGVGLGAAIKAAATGPFTQAIGAMLTEAPRMQLASAAMGSAAQGAAQEAGASQPMQVAAGLVGSALPMAGALPRAASGSPQLQQAAQDARAVGYAIPPADLNPGPVAQVASAVSGKVKTSQSASAKNQEITNVLARRALGLPEDQPINIAALESLRNEAAKAYAPIAGAGIVTPTPGYANALDKAIEPYTSQIQSFPDRKLPQIVQDIQSLKTPQFDAGDAVNTIKVLRSQADTAYRGGDTLAGGAYKGAAKALEDQIESHLAGMGANGADMLQGLRNARTQIAKSYTVQKALNDTTGNVSAGTIAAELKRGKPLTGELRTIAQAAQAFPKATQSLKEAPGGLSAVDAGTAALGGLAHGIAGAAMPLVRPVVRAGLLSAPVQDFMVDRMSQAARPAGQGVPATVAGAALRAFDSTQGQPQARANGGEVFSTYPQAAKARFNRGGDYRIVPADGGFSLVPKFADGGQVAAPAQPSPESAAIDAQAHQAATSPTNPGPQPSQAQQEAGNFKMGHLKVHGLNISIESPEGSTRSGVDPDGTPWQSQIVGAHYGRVKGSIGNDGEHLDAFVGRTPSKVVHVIDQLTPDGSKFDEHKSFINVGDSPEAAKAVYDANYPPGWQGFGAISSMPAAAFRAWAQSGKQLKEPLAYEQPEPQAS